jgi:prolipoprotein diacylglyceryltransferase
VFAVSARSERRAGDAIAAFTAGDAVLRFAVEFVRAAADRASLGPFSTSRWIALVTAHAAVGFVWQRDAATSSASA